MERKETDWEGAAATMGAGPADRVAAAIWVSEDSFREYNTLFEYLGRRRRAEEEEDGGRRKKTERESTDDFGGGG